MTKWQKQTVEMLKAQGVKLFAVEETVWVGSRDFENHTVYALSVFHPDYDPTVNDGPTCQSFRGHDEHEVLESALEWVQNGYKKG